MRVPLAAALVFVALMLAGCSGNAPAPSTSPPSTSTPPATTGTNTAGLTVHILNHTQSTRAGEGVNVTWEVTGNATQGIQIDHTDIHYGYAPVPDPKGDDAYGNTTSPQFGPPRVFTATFNVSDVGRLYLRAHARINGVHYWSSEANLDVAQASKTWTVTIGAPGSGPASSYDPSPVTIRVGDGIKWRNSDPLASTHSATSDLTGASAFDTGSIQPSSDSSVIHFSQPGTYAYHCKFHPNTMKASIVVQAS